MADLTPSPAAALREALATLCDAIEAEDEHSTNGPKRCPVCAAIRQARAALPIALAQEKAVRALRDLVMASDGHHGSFRQRDAAKDALASLASPQTPPEKED